MASSTSSSKNLPNNRYEQRRPPRVGLEAWDDKIGRGIEAAAAAAFYRPSPSVDGRVVE